VLPVMVLSCAYHPFIKVYCRVLSVMVLSCVYHRFIYCIL